MPSFALKLYWMNLLRSLPGTLWPRNVLFEFFFEMPWMPRLRSTTCSSRAIDSITCELRDSVVTALPFRPLCQPDCRGLCSECGVRLSDPGNEDHHHESIDPRWKALQGLPALGEEGEGSDAEETDR